MRNYERVIVVQIDMRILCFVACAACVGPPSSVADRCGLVSHDGSLGWTVPSAHDLCAREGTWTSWYDHGPQRWQGFYRNGKRHGVWTWWHENGSLARQGAYADGGGSGSDDGVDSRGLDRTPSFCPRPMFSFFPGRFVSSRSFEEELLASPPRRPSGSTQAPYLNEHAGGLPCCGQGSPAPDLAELGTADLRRPGCARARGTTGIWHFGYDNGARQARGKLEDGLREAHWQFYADHGALTCEGPYLGGRAHGLWRYYAAQGTPLAEVRYEGAVLRSCKRLAPGFLTCAGALPRTCR